MNIIILSYTKSPQYFYMLRDCINSIGTGHNIFVIETNSKLKDKAIDLPCKFIFPEEEFNYNKFLNIGFKNLKNRDKIIISNNDVIYNSDCIQKLEAGLDIYDSVSPCEYKQKTEVGTVVGKHVKGWCIGLNYRVYEQMGEWDEAFSFWYQDNDYCNFLKKYNLKHALIGNAVAHHKTAASHTLLKNTYASTHGLLSALEMKWTCDG